MNTNTITNILVSGIGGQGVMTAAEILAEAAIDQGFDVKKTEVAGMAQRGGVVTSHIRFGEKVLSPSIAEGQTDIMLSFEVAEALRWEHWLKDDGVILVNNNKMEPPVVNLGLFDYPEDPIAQLKKSSKKIVYFDATAIARELGNMKLVNTIMLGAVSEFLPFPSEVVRDNIIQRFKQHKPKLVAINEEAFAMGHAANQAK
ncbi:MAG: indolepyruvate oxidoreductase subunit beta [Pseudomonadota bacterium]